MPVTIHDIEAAASRLGGLALPTPLLSNPELDRITGGRIWLKCENLQRTGSFKFRGAYNAVAALAPDVRRHGVVACSSGNHAQGVAAAATLLGIASTIVMPADAPRLKVEGTRRLGGRVVPYDRASEDRDAIAARIVAQTGGAFIHPYNDPNVIAGQGTVGLEIAAACQSEGWRPDAVLVPCSGGGFSAGVNLAMTARGTGARIYVVEPAGFDDYGRSLASGSPQRNAEMAGSICDALMAPTPGAISFAINRSLGAGALAVSDDDALAAMAFAFGTLKLVVEPGGATGLAALLSGRFDARGKAVVVVLSGGNVDPERMMAALASPRVEQGV
jgi:threonine dehydratase